MIIPDAKYEECKNGDEWIEYCLNNDRKISTLGSHYNSNIT